MFVSNTGIRFELQWSQHDSIVFLWVFKLILTLGFFCHFPLLLRGQVDLSSFQRVLSSDSNLSDYEYQLVVFSSHKCGFCRKLRSDFQHITLPDKVVVVFVERDTSQDDILEVEKTYKDSEVYIYDENVSLNISFFPTLFLLNSEGEKIKKWRGYDNKTWRKVMRKVK